MAASSRRPSTKTRSVSSSSLSTKQPPGLVRYSYEPSKSKTSVSVSSVARSKREAAPATRPKLQRSASTTCSKPAPAPKDEVKKQRQRSSSFLGSLFRPSVPAAATATKAPRTRTAECLTCGSDDVPLGRTAKLACGHRMCHSCLRRIFTMSIKDPQHMPPRCCASEHIPLKHVDDLFDDKFKILWNRKYQEYTTKNRIYCPAKGCGQWIKPANTHKFQGRKYGRCPKCKTKVCTLCNNKFHSSGECPRDEDTNRLVDMAKERGWQRCTDCRAMIELKEGCNHMTCRCGSQFCMLCASPWKTCDCPWFNYTQVADHDRLNHMRVPQEAQRQNRNDRPDPNDRRQRNDRNQRNPALTYQREIDARRRQERADEALARRLQAASLANNPTPPQRPSRRHTATDEVFGNQGSHFLNDDFVHSAANVVIGALGDAAFARRGERESNRRSRRMSTSMDPGLVPNAFGTDSLLGFGPPPPPAQPPLRRSSTLRSRLGSMSSQSGRERIGGWLHRLG